MPFKCILFWNVHWHVAKPYRRQMNSLTDRVQNWFYLHLLSSWLDLANEGCVTCMSNRSLYSQVHFGWEWVGWANGRYQSAIHMDDTLPSSLLIQTTSSFCKCHGVLGVGRKRVQKSIWDLYHLALFSNFVRETWIIKASASRYLYGHSF